MNETFECRSETSKGNGTRTHENDGRGNDAGPAPPNAGYVRERGSETRGGTATANLRAQAENTGRQGQTVGCSVWSNAGTMGKTRSWQTL